MTLTEEKRLVKETFNLDPVFLHDCGTYYVKSDIGEPIIVEWTPNKKRHWWDAIWDKMDRKMWNGYESELYRIWSRLHPRGGDLEERMPWDKFNHSATPEICWEALITALTKR